MSAWKPRQPRNTGKRRKRGNSGDRSAHSVPLQAWSGPDGSRKLRFPDFMTTAQGGGKVVTHTHRPHLPSRKFFWYLFLLEAESAPGP